ncbi:hypothetical protein M0G74_04615 [Microbulbifer sp. CAU 1566]|uniref:hypothetical protein n=1 Tax=Microbulbifer sp. CAU 1566 TaxID=2933269 RepID=UPI0020030F34|nr:hypothetical protein [Microbulbifer sp. CAU 1566]MCK7596553.1 hypothetical protein [Microbulbifer sp. CAU 1566]
MLPSPPINEEFSYIAFEDSSISCFDLSGVQLIFSGQIKANSRFQDQAVGFQADIYDHGIYEPNLFINVARPFNNNRPKISYLNISDIWWRHYLPSDQGVDVVGSCSLRIRVLWPAPDAFPSISNLKDLSKFTEACFQVAADPDEASEHFLYPKSKKELLLHDIKQRNWLQANHGSYSVDREFSFYTPLTKHHMLHLSFRPQGYWPQGTEPPEDTLNKVFVSFWDFMDKLSIIDEASQQTRTPGIELKGEMLERHLLEQEHAANKETANCWGDDDPDTGGW